MGRNKGMLYSFFYTLAVGLAQMLQFFSPKIASFLKQRNHFETLSPFVKKQNHRLLWFHTSSMGEFEQIIPLLERLRKEEKTVQIAVTFFSPSGFVPFRNTPLADWVSYLPLDKKKQIEKIYSLLQPDLLCLVKYDFWPNLIRVVTHHNTSVIALGATFRSGQVFFWPYSFGMRNILHKLTHIFVLNEASKTLLKKSGIEHVTRLGDLRVDRVQAIKQQAPDLSILENFTENKTCFIAGSTWAEDHAVLAPTVAKFANLKWIIAPHKVNEKNITTLLQVFPNAIRWSQYSEKNRNSNVLLLDTIGVLAAAYRIAEFAYVGGAMGNSGLHNTLEAAVHGIPVFIGPNFKRYPEAVTLVRSGGLRVVKDSKQLQEMIDLFLYNEKEKRTAKKANLSYFKSHQGATEQIFSYINQLILRDNV